MGLKEQMPAFARHEGVWDGAYRHYDAAGKLTDEHRSRVVCRFPDNGDAPYRQTNIYSWPDGREERHELAAAFEDGRLRWDNALIRGWATELPMDDHGRTMVLYWQRADDPDLYVYEMVQLSDSGRSRTRTWHWIRNGELVTRTAIEERLVTRDWTSIDSPRRRAA